MKRLNILLLSMLVIFMASCGGKTGSIELEDFTGEVKEFGGNKTTKFKIKMPKDAKKLNGGLGVTYSKVLSDGMNEININISTPGSENLEALESKASMGSGQVSKKEEKNGGLFLTTKKGKLYDIYYVSADKALEVKVGVPKEHLDLGKEIAMSITASK